MHPASAVSPVHGNLPVSARKDNLPARTNTSSFPLDLRYGAGNLSVYHAITIQNKRYDAWRFANFLPAENANPLVSGETADSVRDHLDNLIEYAIGLLPEIPYASPLKIPKHEGYLSITGTRKNSATDITWAAQGSGDMDLWCPDGIQLCGGTFTAVETVPMNQAEPRFIRLKITRL